MRIAITGLALAAIAGPSAAVDYAARSIPSRIELWPLQTQTVTTPQLLLGQPGTPATIGAELRLPQSTDANCPGCTIGVTTRHPAVVLFHGGGGVISTQDLWAGEFLERGFAVMIVDSVTGRSGGNPNPSVILDAFAALAVLANHPRIDPERIVIMGWSLGAGAALYTAVERFNGLWNNSGINYTAHIGITTNCSTAYIGDTALTGAPVRLFAGLADDLAGVEHCQAYVERVRAAGPGDIAITAYPDARHAFGDPLAFPVLTTMPALRSLRECTLVENPEGVVMNMATGQPYTPNDACVIPGAQFLYNEPAAAALRIAVLDFTAAFGDPR